MKVGDRTPPGLWRHKKTGNLYTVAGLRLTDATNATRGREMVWYSRHISNPLTDLPIVDYVREAGEFLERFEQVGPCVRCGEPEAVPHKRGCPNG